MTPVPVSENAEARTMNDAILSAEDFEMATTWLRESRSVASSIEAKIVESHEALRSLVTDYREALERLTNSIQGNGPNGGKWDTKRALERARRLLEAEDQ